MLQAKADLRNTVRTGAVRRCKDAILERFTGSGLPLKKVSHKKGFAAVVKPGKASWLEGEFSAHRMLESVMRKYTKQRHLQTPLLQDPTTEKSFHR